MNKLACWLGLATFTYCVWARDVNDAKPWTAYISSPSSRLIRPRSIRAVSGDAVVRTSSSGVYTLHMEAGSQITLDFSYVAGWLRMETSSSEPSPEEEDGPAVPHFSLAFAESPAFIRAISDDTGPVYSQDYDKALNVTIGSGAETYCMPRERFRGGFRFVTIHAYRSATISDVVCELGYSPSQEDPSDWAGHFWAEGDGGADDLLVRIWYAGVFTAQTNIAPPYTSRWLPQVEDGWAYNATLGVEGPMLVDGAKRDRAVWSGDLGIAGTTAFLGLGGVGLESMYYALETMFRYQNDTDGMLPYSGPTTSSFLHGSKSDVYHAWALVACFNYALFTGNETWVDTHWRNLTRGVEYIVGRLDNNVGLAEHVYTSDWARVGNGGYHSALNALDYHVLSSFASLAAATATERYLKNLINPTRLSSIYRSSLTFHSNSRREQAESWSAESARLKIAFNEILWDEASTLFRDNETAAGAELYPQDGNALALLYNLTMNQNQSVQLSNALTRNWNEIGPVTPELADTISPFISSVEVLAHFAAGQSRTALDLIRRTWGYMLDSPLMTGKTLIEGMSANGSLAYRSMRSYNHDSAYTSLSHSWSTGPTQALSFKAVGMEITGWKRWVFRPQPGDLETLRTGYVSPMGQFEAVVRFYGPKRATGWTLEATLTAPDGTKGTIQLPFECKSVTIDGNTYIKGHYIIGGGVNEVIGRDCESP